MNAKRTKKKKKTNPKNKHNWTRFSFFFFPRKILWEKCCLRLISISFVLDEQSILSSFKHTSFRTFSLLLIHTPSLSLSLTHTQTLAYTCNVGSRWGSATSNQPPPLLVVFQVEGPAGSAILHWQRVRAHRQRLRLCRRRAKLHNFTISLWYTLAFTLCSKQAEHLGRIASTVPQNTQG